MKTYSDNQFLSVDTRGLHLWQQDGGVWSSQLIFPTNSYYGVHDYSVLTDGTLVVTDPFNYRMYISQKFSNLLRPAE